MHSEYRPALRSLIGWLGFMLSLCSSAAYAQVAGCSRPIAVGLTPAGNAVTVAPDGTVGGLYVEILTQIAAQSHCVLSFSALPRARAVHMFQNGTIDMLAPAPPSEERDKVGEFIATGSTAVTLISYKRPGRNPLLALEKGQLLVNVVRSFDYGPNYQQLLARLQATQMLEEVVDTDTIARKMKAGRADATIMPALIFYPSALEYGMVQELTATVMPDLPTIISGIYLSKQSLAAGDREYLAQHIRKFVQSGEFSRMVKARYSADWALIGYQAAKPASGK